VEAAVAAVPSRRPRLRLVSAMTGGYADPDTLRMPGYWAQHLLQPVLLDAAMSTLLRSGCDTFIELGPGSSMISSLRRLPDWDAGYTAVPMLGRTEGGEHSLLRALGTLWERGADISLDDMPGVYRCALPPHPFSTDDPETCPTTASCRRPSGPPGGRPLEPAVARPGNSPLRDVLERLWCAALGVPSVAAEDDFFALGGESLTVVNLLVQVREKTGLAISVTEFSSDATFARLVQLARQEQTEDASAAVRVVTLQDGPGRPVFLAADAAGNALSYRALAGLLGGVRPVHGLELSGETMAGLTIEDSAAHHVDAVLRTQESGPYTLGGWSFGAVLAHEMARQLVRRGEQVDVLICLDAFVSGGRRLLQSAFDPGLLAGSLWLQTSAVVRIGAVGRQVQRDPGLRQLLLVKSRVVAHYRPQPVSCRAVVLKTGLSRREASRLCDRLSALYLGGVQVLPAGGDHWSMLAHPHVEDLADSLREVLLGSEALS
jgi:phthiocerol/phenolphthiocerol synthesis type-I polyketide synthase E